MEITLDLLLKGKPTIIKEKEFLPTAEYVSEFIKEMSRFTAEFIINVTLPSQLTLTNKEEDITFNKVWIQAIIPSNNKMKEVINLAYALDIKKPCYKVFRTYTEEGRHLVFDSKWIHTGEIKENVPFKLPIKEFMQMENNVSLMVDKMNKTFISDEDRFDYIGKLLNRSQLYDYNCVTGKVKLSPNIVVKANEVVYVDSTSKLYKKDQEATMYDVYVAFLNEIAESYKKDPINVWEKSYLAAQIIGIIDYESN